MTTHELARMLTHFRDAFGLSLKADAAKSMSEAADAFQSLPERPLRDIVKDMQKPSGGPHPLVQQILDAKQGNGSRDFVVSAVQKLRGADLKAVLTSLHLPTRGKVGEQKAAILAFIMEPAHQASEANDDLEAIESAYRIYQELSDSEMSIEELRERFRPLRDSSKSVLVGVAEKLNYRTDGSREDIANRLLQTLEGLCVSRVKNELIGAAH
jgi:hypothetical protein